MQFTSIWTFRDRVYLDGDQSIIGMVTGFQFRGDREPIVEVSWVHNGDAKIAWFEEWRLKKADE